MKILAISNIHGRYDELMTMMEKISKQVGFDKIERIVFLGDYIAYGKKSLGVLNFLKRFKENYPQTIILKGDWEEALWKIEKTNDEEVKRQATEFFKKHGQEENLKKWKEKQEKLDELVEFIDTMPNYYYDKETNFFFSHAGVNMEKWSNEETIEENLEMQTKFDLLWNENFYKQAISFWKEWIVNQEMITDLIPFRIVSGHVSIFDILHAEEKMKINSPFQIGNIYGIDFGAKSEAARLGAVFIEEEGVKTYIQNIGVVWESAKSKASVQKEMPKQTTPEEKVIEEETKNQQIQEKNSRIEQYKRKSNEKEIDSKIVTYNLYLEGNSIEEIAVKRQLKEATVKNHLIEAYKEGRAFDIEIFIEKKNEAQIMKKIAELNTEEIMEIKKELPKGITFTEISAVIAKSKTQEKNVKNILSTL